MGSSGPPIEQAVRACLARQVGVDAVIPLVVAVSGGMDSVVLAHAVRATRHGVILAHVHHGLRGDEADRDADFVDSLAAAWGCPVQTVDIAGALEESRRGESLQDRARQLRYEALARVAEECRASVLLVGHHRDDQAETVLLQLLRGTGPDGLAGMPEARPVLPGSPIRLVRPLLTVGRAQIEEYALANGLTWRDDASNENENYLRNALRMRVLPLLDELAGGWAAGRIARASDLVREYLDKDLAPLAAALRSGACSPLRTGGILIADSVLEPLPEVWKGRLVLDVLERVLPQADRASTTVRRALDLLGSQVGRRVPLDGGAVWRERAGLAIVPDTPCPEPSQLKVGGEVGWNGHVIRLESDAPEPSSAMTRDGILVDVDRVTLPLEVRAWRAGDRIRLRGLDGSRKVKDLLTESKIPAHERAHHPVVATGSDVIWIVGGRSDVRFVAGASTRRTLRLSVDPPDPTDPNAIAE